MEIKSVLNKALNNVNQYKQRRGVIKLLHCIAFDNQITMHFIVWWQLFLDVSEAGFCVTPYDATWWQLYKTGHYAND